MANNQKFSNEERQIFYGNYPLVSESLPLKTSVEEGDVIGVDEAGNYGKYNKSVTYTTPYAIAYEGATFSSDPVNCTCLLAAYVVEKFVKLPENASEKLKLKQELRKIGLFIK